jgi:hypothetical protein
MGFGAYGVDKTLPNGVAPFGRMDGYPVLADVDGIYFPPLEIGHLDEKGVLSFDANADDPHLTPFREAIINTYIARMRLDSTSGKYANPAIPAKRAVEPEPEPENAMLILV